METEMLNEAAQKLISYAIANGTLDREEEGKLSRALGDHTAIFDAVKRLLIYGETHGLMEKEDEIYMRGTIMYLLGIEEWEEPLTWGDADDLEAILAQINDYAYANGIIEDNGVVYRDLFDTKIMGVLTPRPSFVIHKFRSLYEQDGAQAATDWYYAFSRATDYIRTYRVKKDLKWKVPSEYGEIDITINLSKPEKDPKAIAAAKFAKQSGYPKCALCRENEGYAGTVRAAARENHRMIPVTLGGEQWFLQYSPYVYYNEHCIVLSGEHRPMKIDRATFVRMLDFITLFPHYFIGSNADLPIVGGSILTHDHMQGGHYTFAMERAPIELPLHFAGFENVEAGIVKWPLSVIRLCSDDREALVELSDRILSAWRGYTDEAALVFAETNDEPHNTVTPIARRRGEKYEIDLVLRNNLTTEEHPLGLYHPHAQYHNIKKENIGLIEVMGLAVLPSRLKNELRGIEEAYLRGDDIAEDQTLAKHAKWFSAFSGNPGVDKDTIHDVLSAEVGKTFVHVLEDAGVYKCTPAGREAMLRFIAAVNC